MSPTAWSVEREMGSDTEQQVTPECREDRPSKTEPLMVHTEPLMVHTEPDQWMLVSMKNPDGTITNAWQRLTDSVASSTTSSETEYHPEMCQGTNPVPPTHVPDYNAPTIAPPPTQYMDLPAADPGVTYASPASSHYTVSPASSSDAAMATLPPPQSGYSPAQYFPVAMTAPQFPPPPPHAMSAYGAKYWSEASAMVASLSHYPPPPLPPLEVYAAYYGVPSYVASTPPSHSPPQYPSVYSSTAQYCGPPPTAVTSMVPPPQPVYSTAQYYGSNASHAPFSGSPSGSPPGPAAAHMSHPTTVEALPETERLNLDQAPMVQPPAAQHLPHSSDMAEVWHSYFDSFFSKFDGSWELIPAVGGYQGEHDGVFEDSAKIRFVCKNCRNAWTSMQGKVKFWHKYDRATKKGSVHFQLFGQKCRECTKKKGFNDMEDSLWYHDEIFKVVHNIHAKVGMIYFSIPNAQIQIQRRIGRPKGQHNSALCGACQNGICRRNNPSQSPPVTLGKFHSH